MLRKLKDLLKRNENLITVWYLLRQFYYKYFFSDEELIKKKFLQKVGREVNLDNPKKFNDKLQWLKLNWYDPLAVKCADKYAVREFIKEKIGEEYLNELYSVYNSVDKVDLSELPEQFVLKGTHGSGFNIICKDKSRVNWKKQKTKMKRWFKRNFYWETREWVYKDIKPRIIAEKYLEESNSEELKDYKIYCFNGVPKLIQVDIDRFGNHKQNFYDESWNFKDVKIWCENDKNIEVKKPKNYNDMIRISKILSNPFPHVRVDLYNIKGKIYFGELTFFHQSGFADFIDIKLEDKMGEWLDLNKIDNNGVYKYE